MNIIQNYGITNYQTNFQARGDKKVVKTLADIKRMPPDLRKQYKTAKASLNYWNEQVNAQLAHVSEVFNINIKEVKKIFQQYRMGKLSMNDFTKVINEKSK